MKIIDGYHGLRRNIEYFFQGIREQHSQFVIFSSPAEPLRQAELKAQKRDSSRCKLIPRGKS